MSLEELFFLAEAFKKTDSLLSFSHDRDFVEGPGNDLFTAAVWESGHQHFSARWIGHDGHLLLDFLTWLQEDNSGKEGGKRNVIFSNFAFSNNTQRYGFWLKGAISKISDVPQQRMVIIFLHLCGWWVWIIWQIHTSCCCLSWVKQRNAKAVSLLLLEYDIVLLLY